MPAGVREKVIFQNMATEDSVQFVPPDIRDWSNGDACGIDTTDWKLALPTTGKSEVQVDGWRYRVIARTPSHAKVEARDPEGRAVFVYDYVQGRGVTRLNIGYPDGSIGERLQLTRGLGFLWRCRG